MVSASSQLLCKSASSHCTQNLMVELDLINDNIEDILLVHTYKGGANIPRKILTENSFGIVV